MLSEAKHLVWCLAHNFKSINGSVFLVILSLTLWTHTGCVAWHALGGLLAIQGPHLPDGSRGGGSGQRQHGPYLGRVSLRALSCCEQAFLADSVRRHANTRRVRYHAPDRQDALLEADMWRLQPIRRIH